MSPKKAKSKKKVKSDLQEKEQLSEVDKTFYELQIADLNRKLTRLKTLSTELEGKNAELSLTNAKLDEDRADVIAFLKRNLKDKTDEITDLVDRLQSLREKRQEETEDFTKQLQGKYEKFKNMEDQLNSEIKLLNGKLDVLEEFRVQKEELTKKCEVQQQEIKEQEERHKKEMYDVERKFIVDKDTFKRHLEQKIMELSQEFQELTDMRIASSTKRLVMENIAINNELNALFQERKTLVKENNDLKEYNKKLKIEGKIHEESLKQVMTKNKILKTVIKDLTVEYHKLKQKLTKTPDLEVVVKKQEIDIKSSKLKINELHEKIKNLKETLQKQLLMSKEYSRELELNQQKISFFSQALFQRVFSIRNIIRVQSDLDDQTISEEIKVEYHIMDHKDQILQDLYELFLQVRQVNLEGKRMESWNNFYGLGSLGFVPRQKSISEITEKNVETQIGVSFEEFLDMSTPSLKDFDSDSVTLEELPQDPIGFP